MWVEETKKGKYKYIERYTDPLTGVSSCGHDMIKHENIALFK